MILVGLLYTVCTVQLVLYCPSSTAVFLRVQCTPDFRASRRVLIKKLPGLDGKFPARGLCRLKRFERCWRPKAYTSDRVLLVPLYTWEGHIVACIVQQRWAREAHTVLTTLSRRYLLYFRIFCTEYHVYLLQRSKCPHPHGSTIFSSPHGPCGGNSAAGR